MLLVTEIILVMDIFICQSVTYGMVRLDSIQFVKNS